MKKPIGKIATTILEMTYAEMTALANSLNSMTVDFDRDLTLAEKLDEGDTDIRDVLNDWAEALVEDLTDSQE